MIAAVVGTRTSECLLSSRTRSERSSTETIASSCSWRTELACSCRGPRRTPPQSRPEVPGRSLPARMPRPRTARRRLPPRPSELSAWVIFVMTWMMMTDCFWCLPHKRVVVFFDHISTCCCSCLQYFLCLLREDLAREKSGNRVLQDLRHSV